mgnify:CR=1 FL=1|tara:strand:- start:12333 stop:12506 length:174 start_codon:yes stop_codon:yes gene_type:complete
MIIEIIVIAWLYMLTGLFLSFSIDNDEKSGFDSRRAIVLWPWYVAVKMYGLIRGRLS